MILFLTSLTDDPKTGKLNTANNFTNELRNYYPKNPRGLNICSNPDDYQSMDYYSALLRNSFEQAHFSFDSYEKLDGRNYDKASELVSNANIIILSGGHVPTQNSFFHKIGLRKLLKNYDGIVIGISAGSMNSADIVYSMPEEEGEAIDKNYQRFLSGLNLTKVMLLPHYDSLSEETLDGLKLYPEIACPDSMGRTFYAIPDGSYLFKKDDIEELRGEAYMIHDGIITKVSSNGEVYKLSK